MSNYLSVIPLPSYFFWVGLVLTQASHDQPLTEPWTTAVLTMAAIFEFLRLEESLGAAWVKGA